MKVKTCQIHWHNKQPIYSVDFHPSNANKLVTCGGDNNVRLWNVLTDAENGEVRIEFLATLTKHMKSVNCVRFAPNGETLASAGDGGMVILWRLTDAPIQFNRAFGDASDDEDGADRKEFWTVTSVFRAPDGEDVYDMAWSPDGRFLAVALTDNTTQVWDVAQARCIRTLRDHQHFVQGVAWDPHDQFVVTQSADRSVKVWALRGKSGTNTPSFCPLSRYLKTHEEDGEERTLASPLFHDETLVSFFRRPAFSPDGALLALPAGLCTPQTPNAASVHGIHLNWRNNLHQVPAAFIGGFEKAPIAVRFHPRLFPLLSSGEDSLYVQLPYRLVFAVATQNAVYIYDTQHRHPLFMLGNMHYAALTDVSWSADGRRLVFCSVDGFCTVASFAPADDFGAEPLDTASQTAIFAEHATVVRSTGFNTAVSRSAKRNSIAGVALGGLTAASDVGAGIAADVADVADVDMCGTSGSLGADVDSTVVATNGTLTHAVIHNPPVKRRVAPTLLSVSSTQSPAH